MTTPTVSFSTFFQTTFPISFIYSVFSIGPEPSTANSQTRWFLRLLQARHNVLITATTKEWNNQPYQFSTSGKQACPHSQGMMLPHLQSHKKQCHSSANASRAAEASHSDHVWLGHPEGRGHLPHPFRWPWPSPGCPEWQSALLQNRSNTFLIGHFRTPWESTWNQKLQKLTFIESLHCTTQTLVTHWEINLLGFLSALLLEGKQ